MIADGTVERYYYIFDSREHRALVLDRATGEEVAWAASPLVKLLEHVAEDQGPAVLRRFARWCARQTAVHTAPRSAAAERLWAAAQQGDDAQAHARREMMDVVVEATALGLPQGRSRAAQVLTAHACTHPDSRRAAIDAAHMSERWAEFEADPDPRAAVQRIRQRQIDWLLDVLGGTDAQ